MDIIIIGAGAAGLIAAKQLSARGRKVIVLEARNRLGGRIFTSFDPLLNRNIEGGAEFIHGNLPETLALLKEADIGKRETQGDFWQVSDGKWKRESDFFSNADLVIRKMKALKEDISIRQFLDLNFKEEKYAGLHNSLTSYVEGYYSGETGRTSTKSFLQEWLSEDEQQYRPAAGYGEMIQYLADSCTAKGGVIKLNTVVKEIQWSKEGVEVIDEAGGRHLAAKALITLPLGLWTAEENERGAIKYLPALPEKIKAAKALGFGEVTKVLLAFKTMFWEDKIVQEHTGAPTNQLQMALSDASIPTWWTQLPERIPLLTGWLSGPKAAAMKDENEETILQKSLESLSSILGRDMGELQQQLLWCKVFNWTTDEFTCGSYSYSTTQTLAARKILSEPIENTLFFAGEALYDGPEMGTVEAALISGRQAAETIMA